ncbi:MAG: DUF2723 domain-containing protein [Bacteroidota bacterium]|nr:DUF2723 domain-containing protein [Bacteroidota bacterium]
MDEKIFKKWNLILGWSSFLIAFIVYYLTSEPTVGFWDTGEYITTSAKLQVGHPPGAPLFQMLGAIFSIFALNSDQIGFTLNLMSGFASALTIAFMFWSITMLLSKISNNLSDSKDKSMAILGAALTGSLAFTFTDTFWFNAVETETYAMGTLIMAVLFYLALRWEQDMNSKKGNKWLVLISFIIGLSFGIHFMGLLTIPAIVLIYFFKNYQTVNIKNFLIANIAGVAIVMIVFKLILPPTLKFFSFMELFFVNDLGLPFNSGTIASFFLIALLFYFFLSYTSKKKLIVSNTLGLCVLFIFIGFSSWIMLPIRANADVVVNENNPSTVRELLAYYNLEQYPKTYLFYGPLFTDQYSGLDEENPYTDDKPKYEKDEKNGKYIVVNDYKNATQNFNSKHASFLPRMWSPEHAENYLRYSGFLNFKVKPKYISENSITEIANDFKAKIQAEQVDYETFHKFLKQYGQFLDIEKPSILSNIYYSLDFQIGYMYWRYFMWNFTGRQDDIQGKWNMHGNWISGINFIDEIHLGISQENLPSDVLNNKARNTYYFLPFILGLIGLTFLWYRNRKLFWVMFVFFLFTGIGIQIYTNVRMFEPRERDYIVVGSFYVFAMWIGFGCYAIWEYLKSIIKIEKLSIPITLVCIALVPGILAANNWDDHDRSGRYTAHAMAVNYLESCAPNAILFTIGDNDTFPLWYAQEIEGIRTDVRVVNTSLLSTDWYIDQMKRKAYVSDPIPSSLTHDKYKYGTRDYIIKETITNDTLDLNIFLDFITRDEKRFKYKALLDQQGYDTRGLRSQDLNANYLPSENIRIPVNKENVISNNIVNSKDANEIVDEIIINIKGQALYKNRLLMLDIIASNEWNRPIYFSGGAFGDEDYIWMKDYLQVEGVCYKLVPIKTPINPEIPYEMGRVDTEIMYPLVKKWAWGKRKEQEIYYDVESRKNSITYRGNMIRLVDQLIKENEIVKAEEILDLAMEKMPIKDFGFYTLLEPFINSYYKIGKSDKAREMFEEISKKYQENLEYYSSISNENKNRYAEEIYTDIERYRSLVDVLISYEEGDYLESKMQEFNDYLDLFL